jgi:hypothetical protein
LRDSKSSHQNFPRLFLHFNFLSVNNNESKNSFVIIPLKARNSRPKRTRQKSKNLFTRAACFNDHRQQISLGTCDKQEKRPQFVRGRHEDKARRVPMLPAR